ncbi:hypothetical protein T02_6848 [Trichinella nativa]|uniref:Uncharacterized protein n=1 Tax=Trichinella nativa TaxID=6335 RepID=A0A0V1KIZ6_9BILA|nr:hypothetical protein T02_6848 [Trichinella nativa]
MCKCKSILSELRQAIFQAKIESKHFITIRH